MYRLTNIYSYTLILCFLYANAFAQPIPRSKTESLKAFEAQLEQQKHEQKKLQDKLNRQQNDLKSTQNKLVELGRIIQSNEAELQVLENQISKLEHDQNDIQQRLTSDKVSLSRLLTVMERLSRTPPQALIVKPDAPIKAAQSALLLQNILPTLNNRADQLKKDLDKLSSIRLELDEKYSKVGTKSLSLKEEQIKLSSLVKERKKLTKLTQRDLKSQEQEIKKISLRATDLKDLMKRLEKKNSENRERAERMASLKAAVSMGKGSESLSRDGSAQLPISGIIRTRYRQLDEFGAPSEGIRIEGRSRGLVVAPIAGTVRFAGTFKNYGQMVIIEHSDHYHSLIGGLKSVDVTLGQIVSAGEPVGKLNRTSTRGKPVLYYELRHNGKPINPARKLADLG